MVITILYYNKWLTLIEGLTHWMPELFAKNTFWRSSAWLWATLSSNQLKRLCHKTACLSFHPHHVLQHLTCVFRLLFFYYFFTFPFSPFLIFLLQWLNFYWACFQLKNFWERIIKTGNFYHGVAKCSGRKFCYEIFTQISQHLSAYFSQSLWSGYHWKQDLFLLGQKG